MTGVSKSGSANNKLLSWYGPTSPPRPFQFDSRTLLNSPQIFPNDLHSAIALLGLGLLNLLEGDWPSAIGFVGGAIALHRLHKIAKQELSNGIENETGCEQSEESAP